MKFRSIMIALLFALTSGVAFASSCPKHMKAGFSVARLAPEFS